MDECTAGVGQERVSGRAKAGLEVQGTGKKVTEIRVPNCHEVEDNWMAEPGPHMAWSQTWIGRTIFEASDGSWKDVVQRRPRRAMMPPVSVKQFQLPGDVVWTGRRITYVYPIDGEGTTDPRFPVGASGQEIGEGEPFGHYNSQG